SGRLFPGKLTQRRALYALLHHQNAKASAWASTSGAERSASRRNVVKSDEIHVLATPMFRHLEKVAYAFKAAGAGEIRSDVVERYRRDRINFDLAVLHSVPV